MFSFESRTLTRTIIYILALLIMGSSLIYSNYLASRLAEKESQGVMLYADALDFVGNFRYGEEVSGGTGADQALDFILTRLVIDRDSLVPLILVGEEGDTSTLNIEFSADPAERSKEIREYIEEFSDLHPPIEVEFSAGRYQRVYYGESYILRQLRWFPFMQLLVAFVFIGLVFAGFAVAKRNEQNRVWVGLAKETAHQLGTPVSSLMAWLELLKSRDDTPDSGREMLDEMEHDVRRLEMITDRFSKIGSKPELLEVNVAEFLDRSAAYLKNRMSSRGHVVFKLENRLPAEAVIFVNPQLFDWVIENLLKNALDAIQGQDGEICLEAAAHHGHYFIEVTDTGKGISKKHFKKVFEPGFTTKKRGWGLGLSLSKRIVENYHRGKIFVKSSEIGKGTTFRVLLPN